jgi:hypothetical protein
MKTETNPPRNLREDSSDITVERKFKLLPQQSKEGDLFQRQQYGLPRHGFGCLRIL